MAINTETGFASAWKFKDSKNAKDANGAVFTGRWNGSLELADTKYGEKAVAGFTEEETGEAYSIWLFNEALRSQFLKIKPAEGELIEIAYLGERTSKAGNNYQNFTIKALERPVEKLSWYNLGGESDLDEDEF